jgi:hypothetical protein
VPYSKFVWKKKKKIVILLVKKVTILKLYLKSQIHVPPTKGGVNVAICVNIPARIFAILTNQFQVLYFNLLTLIVSLDVTALMVIFEPAVDVSCKNTKLVERVS